MANEFLDSILFNNKIVMNFIKSYFVEVNSLELLNYFPYVDAHWVEYNLLVNNIMLFDFEYSSDLEAFDAVKMMSVKDFIKRNRITVNGYKDKEFRKYWEDKGYAEYFKELEQNKYSEYNPPFICHACQNKVLETRYTNEKCSVCGWIDDEAQIMFPDLECGENIESLTEYRKKLL